MRADKTRMTNSRKQNGQKKQKRLAKSTAPYLINNTEVKVAF